MTALGAPDQGASAFDPPGAACAGGGRTEAGDLGAQIAHLPAEYLGRTWVLGESRHLQSAHWPTPEGEPCFWDNLGL